MEDPPRTLAPLATLVALVACYGTLVLVALLGALGLAVAVNEAVWAVAILAFAWLAVVGLLLGRRRHGRLWPLALAIFGAVVISLTMTVAYHRLVELGGFALLVAGTVADWRLGRTAAEPQS